MLHKCRAGYNEVTYFQITEIFLQSYGIIENLTISLNCNRSDILQQRTHDVELKKYCVELLENLGSLSYTRQTLQELDDEIRAEVAKLGGNTMLNELLDKLIEWKLWSEEKNPEK
jgi:hypothetical protein